MSCHKHLSCNCKNDSKTNLAKTSFFFTLLYNILFKNYFIMVKFSSFC